MPTKITRQLKKVVRTIQILALVTLIFWAVNRIVAYFQHTQALWYPGALGQDAATIWEDRLLALKSDLPERGVIGYISEQDYPGVSFNAVDQDEEFVLTQYSLAPLILDRGSTHYELVIGNFSAEYEYQFEDTFGLRQVANYGNGIYLFQGQSLP